MRECSLSTFRSVMETNYFGVIRCTQAVLPQMRERRSGCIINVSSVAGRIAVPPFGAYCSSKWAQEALSEMLAAEMKTFHVRVLIVEPGVIDTAMARRISAPKNASPYGQNARLAGMFTESLKTPVPPSLVAAKILEVAESGTWTLRHPVGPDVLPFMQWRNSMTDEKWVDVNGGDDAKFFASLAGA